MADEFGREFATDLKAGMVLEYAGKQRILERVERIKFGYEIILHFKDGFQSNPMHFKQRIVVVR